MGWIYGIARTNLPGYECDGMRKFVALPRLGDFIEVKKGGKRTTLKVTKIIHRVESDETGHPYLEILLDT